MKLKNKYKKIGDEYYSWEVLLDGTQNELNNIKNVTYKLHESFPNQMMVSSNASNKFLRKTSGWGEFLIRADIEMKNGKTKHGELWLDLGFPNTKKHKKKYKGEIK